MENQIQPSEIVEVLRRVIKGQSKIDFEPSYAWDGRLTVVMNFRAEGYLISIFIDAGEFDYMQYAIAPDGRKGDFDYWELDVCPEDEPIDQLTDEERAGLVKRLEERQLKYESKSQ